jgi:SAM-dependent methyltransferase
MTKEKSIYEFKWIEHCNMCDTPTEQARVLGQRLNQSQGIRPTKKRGITTSVLKCRNCSLIFANPMPVPGSIAQHYGIPPESYWNEGYFQIDKNYFKPVIDTFLTLRGKNENSEKYTALDIGSGIGKCLIALEDAGITAYGIEPSKPFLDNAVNRMKIPKDKIFNQSVEEINLPNLSFDFINFNAVLEHFYDPSESIKKVLPYLKPKGLIHIHVPYSEWLTNKIFNLMYKMQGLNYVANISPMHIPFHLYEFSLKSFELNGKKNGYFVKHHKILNLRQSYLGPLNPVFFPIMEMTKTGMLIEIWLQKNE